MTAQHTERWSRLAPLLVAVGAIAVLHGLGLGSLAAPPAATLAAVQTWAHGRDPATLAMSLVRLAGLAVGYQFLAVTVVMAAARSLHLPGVAHLAERCTLPVLRRAVAQVAGLGLRASVLAAVVTPGAAGAIAAHAEPAPATHRTPGTGTAVLRLLPEAVTEQDPAPGQATLRLVDPRPLTPSRTPTSPSTSTLRPTADPPPRPSPGLPPWVVEPGDHLWSIAEQTVAAAHRDQAQPAPPEPEISRYWRALIAANPAIDDPDVIRPGQPVLRPPLLAPPPIRPRISPTPG